MIRVIRYLIIVFAVVFFIPPDFVRAQSVSVYPNIEQSSRYTDWRAVQRTHFEQMASSSALYNPTIRPEPFNEKLVSHKLNVLADALMNQNIRGLARLKTDKFTGAYIAAIGFDLKSWVESHGEENYFVEIFRIHNVCVVMLLAVSPTSMHEYFPDLDLPSTPGDILEVNHLPSSLIVVQKEGGLSVEALGTDGLRIIFWVNQKDEVSVISA